MAVPPAVQAALELYALCLKKSVASFVRSVYAVVFLAVVNFVVFAMLGEAGAWGGLLVIGVLVLTAAEYLKLVRAALPATRTLTPMVHSEEGLALFWAALPVLFILSLPHLVLSYTAPNLAIFWVVAVALLLNPLAEVLYNNVEDEPLDLVLGAFSFIGENWPEWLAPHGVVALLMAGLVVPGWVSWQEAVQLGARLFGPTLDLAAIWPLLHHLKPEGGLVLGMLCGVVHFLYLFRGHLYAELSGSTRRGRMWRAQH